MQLTTENMIKYQKMLKKIMAITITVMTMMLRKTNKEKKLIVILAAKTIQHHRGPWKTCKVSSLKIPVSA